MYSGVDGATLRLINPSDVANDGFGAAIDTGGDSDGDGSEDVLIGAIGDDTAGSNAGRVYVFAVDTGTLIATIEGPFLEAEFGIGLGQWYFLRALWEGDGLTQRELSARVGLEENTAVTALRALERGGWIRRIRDEEDRRRRLVFLTERGSKLRGKLIPMAREVNEESVADLSAAEVRELKRLIQLVRATLLEAD